MGGQDKGLVRLNDRSMVEYVIEALRPQVSGLIINANRNAETYAEIGDCPVVTDIIPDYAGPLAGMASAMQAANTKYIVTAPCDSPFLAGHMVERLYVTLKQQCAQLSVAADGLRMQPVFALIPCSLLNDLLTFLKTGGRKIDRWYEQHHTVVADLSDARDSFLNINSREDLKSVRDKLQQLRNLK